MNRDTRTINSIRNIGMSIAQKFLSIFLVFISRQIFLSMLSMEYLGLNALFMDVLKMLSVADMGITTAMAYSFYKPLAEKNEEKLSALIQFYRRIFNIIAAVVAVAGISLTPFIRHIINIEQDIPFMEVYYLIALSGTVISYLYMYKSTIITADQKNSIITRYAMWTTMITLVLQIAALLTLKSFLLYCFIPALTTLLNNLLISGKANRLYPFIRNKIRLDIESKKEIFRNVRSLVVYKTATVFATGTDNILISALVGTAVVGQYSNYYLAVTNLGQIAFILFNSLTPSIGNLVVMENPKKQLGIFNAMQTVSVWISGFFTFCLFFLMDDFVSLWLGFEYTFSLPTKIIILINFYISMTFFPVISFREAAGMFYKIRYIMVITAALKIMLSIVLGIHFQTAGILAATAIAKILTISWFEPKVLFGDFFGDSAKGYFIGQIVNFFILASCIALVYAVMPNMEIIGWMGWIVRGIILTLLINAVYLLRFYRKPEFQVLVGKAMGLINKKLG